MEYQEDGRSLTREFVDVSTNNEIREPEHPLDNNICEIDSHNTKGFILDIEGIKTEIMHDKWWRMLETIYDSYANKKEILVSRTLVEEDMFQILKNKLMRANTWGVFIHYLCYHGDQNVYTGASFQDHLQSLYSGDNGMKMDQFLSLHNYYPSYHKYIDSDIINDLVVKYGNGEIIGYEEYDTGKVTLVCRSNPTKPHEEITQDIIRILQVLQIPTQNLSHIKCTILPGVISDFCVPFLPLDVNKTHLYRLMKQKNLFLQGLYIIQFTHQHKDKHFLLSSLERFTRETMNAEMGPAIVNVTMNLMKLADMTNIDNIVNDNMEYI